MTTANYFNTRQKKIITFCEQVHEAGIVHSGLSGTLCENILIKYLAKDIPKYRFFKGHVLIKDNENNRGLSPQYNILICKKKFKPVYNYMKEKVHGSITVVPLKFVVGVIEVKKWSCPSMIKKEGSVNAAFRKFKEKLKKDKPYFFVSFRFKDRKNDNEKRWEPLKENLATPYKYCFFGPYTTNKENKKPKYPWEEACWKNFDRDCQYKGYYKKLIDDINAIR